MNIDILNDVLDTLQLQGTVYFRTDFSPPWAVEVPRYSGAARFHMLLQGSCHVQFASGENIQLQAGDLLLIPHGACHVIHDGDHPEAPPLQSVLEDAGYDGEGVLVINGEDTAASTQMVCGHFSFRPYADHPLLRLMPEHLLVKSSKRHQHVWLDEICRLITRKVFSDDVAAQASVRRLTEVMFVELLQASIHQSATLKTLLEAFQDRKIAHALALIHHKPGESWAVDQLAREVGMSRSRFADRFSKLLGMGPMTYLSEWRLQKALSLLSRADTNAQQVAYQTGYKSAAAFSRAFSSKFGISPSEYRSQTAAA